MNMLMLRTFISLAASLSAASIKSPQSQQKAIPIFLEAVRTIIVAFQSNVQFMTGLTEIMKEVAGVNVDLDGDGLPG